MSVAPFRLFISSVAAGILCVSARASAAPSAERDADYEFLVRHMPAKDRGVVGEDYLRRNVALAREAMREAPWRDAVPREIFLEYVLPYSSIGEDVDDWRGTFRAKFWPLVKGCKTTGEAVAVINSRIGGLLGVHYDTRRDKPDQSPFHSMRIGMASCTGLSILQIDAFRACGIPARFVGCRWTDMSGNHSWVEYYDRGTWHFYNDPADGKLVPPDESWFAPHAALADGSSPRTKIYAARWSPSGMWFWGTWRGGDGPTEIPADDVTASYRRFRKGNPKCVAAFVAYGPGKRRVSVPFLLKDPGTGKALAEGVTFDESHDMNDHVSVSLPEGTVAKAYVKLADGRLIPAGEVKFLPGRRLYSLGAFHLVGTRKL